MLFDRGQLILQKLARRLLHMWVRLVKFSRPSRFKSIAVTAYRMPTIRFLHMRIRLWLLGRSMGVQSLDSHESVAETVKHNLKSLASQSLRNEHLLMSSMCIENIINAKTLVIGCRNEEELMMFRGYGFRDITAVDIISYSPRILLGDMHNLDFPDNYFDFIFCAYTLSYSGRPRTAANEMIRVCKSGGHVAAAIEYMPWGNREQIQMALVGYSLLPGEKLESADDVIGLFRPNVGNVIVRYDAELKRHHLPSGLVSDPSPVIAVFRVAKHM